MCINKRFYYIQLSEKAKNVDVFCIFQTQYTTKNNKEYMNVGSFYND